MRFINGKKVHVFYLYSPLTTPLFSTNFCTPARQQSSPSAAKERPKEQKARGWQCLRLKICMYTLDAVRSSFKQLFILKLNKYKIIYSLFILVPIYSGLFILD